MLMQVKVRQVVRPDLVFFSLSLIKDDVDKVLLASQVVLGCPYKLSSFLFVIDLVVYAGARVQVVPARHGASS